MTGNPLLDLAISATGIAFLFGLAKFLFGSASASVTLERAEERLSFEEPDFEPVAWLLNDDKTAALARNASGEIAIIVSHGADLATRRFGPGQAEPKVESGVLRIYQADHAFKGGAFQVTDDEAEAWLASQEAG